MADKLTPKQEMFIREYLIDLNATQAYIRAGYNVKSEDVAAVNANRLLSNAKIQAEIQQAMDKRAEKTGITADFVLNGIKNIAVTGEKETDKLRAYELLGKHLKLFTEKIEEKSDQSININFNIPRPKRE